MPLSCVSHPPPPPGCPWVGVAGTRAAPRSGPGAGQGEPGCCGAGWDLPADVSVPSLSAARRVRTSPGDVARSPLHFSRADLALMGVQ